jgi:hypothetical protein
MEEFQQKFENLNIVTWNLGGLIILNTCNELQGHRAELYAARVAKCLAALEGREKVYVDDLKKAVSFLWNLNTGSTVVIVSDMDATGLGTITVSS